MRKSIILAMALLSGVALASEQHGLVVNTPPEGSVTREAGLEAWERIHAVVSHPRCANCHTDEKNLPMWSGPEYADAQPHGMNIHAGESRIGAETLACQACHVTSKRPNTVPHAAPHAGMDWRLAPVEFVWFGVDGPAICAQIRDPERNGGRDGAGLVEHITHDAEEKGFITWGFNPGAGREPAPGGMQAHLEDMIRWVAADMPCPED